MAHPQTASRCDLNSTSRQLGPNSTLQRNFFPAQRFYCRITPSDDPLERQTLPPKGRTFCILSSDHSKHPISVVLLRGGQSLAINASA